MKGKNETLQRSLPFLAAILAGKAGKLHVGGKDCETNGDTTWIRDFPQDSDWYRLAVGALFHENAGHGQYTDFSVSDTAADNPVRFELLNIIEDPRIERAAARDFPGGLRNIADVIAYYQAEGRFPPPTKDDHPGKILGNYCLYRQRAELPYQGFLKETAAVAGTVFEEVFGAGLRIKLDALLNEAPTLTSTADALDLTDAIITMLKEEQEKPKNPKPQGSQGQNDPKSGNDGAQQGGGQDQDQKAKADGSGQGKPDKQGNAEAIAKALSATSDDLGTFDAFETAKDALRDAAAQGHGDSGLPSLPSESGGKESTGAGSGGSQAVSRVSRTVGPLRAQIQGLVEANREDDVSHRSVGSRVDPREVRRLQIGDTRIFHSVIDRRAPDTVVHVLLDRSISMRRSVGDDGTPQKVEVALDAALSLSLALEGIPDVNVAVTAFPGAGGNDLKVIPLQKVGERARAAAQRFGINADGGTPMAEALLYAVFQVLQDRSTRKIILVVSDGDPDRPEPVKELVDRAMASGVEVMGIGIGTDSVRSLFPTAVVISNASELRKALFDLVRESLLAA